MDISALASMKSAAKCDTWCELQNPVNHRVFERKLRPRPAGQGHVRLGVKRCAAPCQLHHTYGCVGQGPDVQSGSSCQSVRRVEERVIVSLATNNKGWMKSVSKAYFVSCWPEKRLSLLVDPDPCADTQAAAWNATPGWARPPAEFKHINKRRRRNLQGFP